MAQIRFEHGKLVTPILRFMHRYHFMDFMYLTEDMFESKEWQIYFPERHF